MSYWTFSDVFEEVHSILDNEMKRPPFHNGYGLVSVDGIPKPSFRALELLSWMPNETLPTTMTTAPTHNNWVNVLAGIPNTEDQIMHILLVSFAPIPTWDAVQDWDVSLNIKGLATGIVRASADLYRVDDTHANAWAEWKRKGSPSRQQINESTIAELNASSALTKEAHPCNVGGGSAKDTVQLNLKMPKIGMAVAVLHWTY